MIRKAYEKDISRILELLKQVNKVHYDGRPDLFKLDTKYTHHDLIELLNDESKPIFVITDESDLVNGYCFCQSIEIKNNQLMQDIKTLYIDDLCVDENKRGCHLGSQLYEYVKSYAKNNNYYNLTLNVWELNEPAMKFYQKMGLIPQKTTMETIL